MMRRQHDVQVLAEGTFRVVLTRSGRVVLAIDVPDSALGPLHLAFGVGEGPGAPWADWMAADSVVERMYQEASARAATMARPACALARDAASIGALLVAPPPFLLPETRDRLESASRTILRARLGDVTARQFVRDVVDAARTGAAPARHAGDALLAGTQVVSRVLDAPLAHLGRASATTDPPHALQPFVKLEQAARHIHRGDFDALQSVMESEENAGAAHVEDSVSHYVQRYAPDLSAAAGPLSIRVIPDAERRLRLPMPSEGATP
jgi:hypothetical protein